ncbi:hypothetical protein J7382_17420 [Shimia sp. R11_0]|uniref:hypothetical protein n=1 Tax=Shimia sp. R11_0 TaxID=2821096 RepID=UPI001ADC456D|nr:hypothetical protein [Shimia sp. R11_0]MBO9479328.1 hypothetical protein [Shimia sp. R11_0]
MEKIEVTNVEILQQARNEEDNTLSAEVKIHYAFGDLGARAMIATLEISAKKDAPWRRIKRRLHAKAWEWLYDYFDGAALGDDCENFFAQAETTALKEESGPGSLPRDEELAFQRELHDIVYERAY